MSSFWNKAELLFLGCSAELRHASVMLGPAGARVVADLPPFALLRTVSLKYGIYGKIFFESSLIVPPSYNQTSV